MAESTPVNIQFPTTPLIFQSPPKFTPITPSAITELMSEVKSLRKTLAGARSKTQKLLNAVAEKQVLIKLYVVRIHKLTAQIDDNAEYTRKIQLKAVEVDKTARSFAQTMEDVHNKEAEDKLLISTLTRNLDVMRNLFRKLDKPLLPPPDWYKYEQVSNLSNEALQKEITWAEPELNPNYSDPWMCPSDHQMALPELEEFLEFPDGLFPDLGIPGQDLDSFLTSEPEKETTAKPSTAENSVRVNKSEENLNEENLNGENLNKEMSSSSELEEEKSPASKQLAIYDPVLDSVGLQKVTGGSYEVKDYETFPLSEKPDQDEMYESSLFR